MANSLSSIFLAQSLGLYFLITGIIMLARASYYREFISRLTVGSSSILILSTLGLIFGILLVLLHNHWVWDTEVIITIIAWLILIKSILWLSVPEYMVNISRNLYTKPIYYLSSGITIVLGIILIIYGFYSFA